MIVTVSCISHFFYLIRICRCDPGMKSTHLFILYHILYREKVQNKIDYGKILCFHNNRCYTMLKIFTSLVNFACLGPKLSSAPNIWT